MEPTFTHFLQGLPDEPEPARFLQVWERLGAMLRQELRRRNLWNSSPSFVGVYGWRNWEGQEPGTSDDQGPLAELVAECYTFIFIDRLAALRAQMEIKPTIEGLVLLNVRHFLHERQRAHDPIGFRVFEMLREAVRQGIEAGELFVLTGDPRLRNETVLGFDPASEPEAREQDLGAWVSRWNDDLLPDLLLARGRQQSETIARLRANLRDLERSGVHSFSVRSVIDPLKSDTRARWAALMEEARGEREPPDQVLSGHRVPPGAADPPSAFEIEESYAHLAQEVAALVDGMSTDPRTRRYLASLWRFLSIQAHEEGTEEWEELSHRKLSQLLDIPRERLPDLFATLQRLVAQCRETTRRSPMAPGAEKDSARDRLEISGSGKSR